MALTNFIPRETLVTAAWLNEVDATVQDVIDDPKVTREELAASTGSALVGDITSGTGAVAQTLRVRNSWTANIMECLTGVEQADVINKTKTINLTSKINAWLASKAGYTIDVPSGHYLYTGGGELKEATVLKGSSRQGAKFYAATGNAGGTGSLFYVSGLGAGIRSLGFDSLITQTADAYVYLGGINCFIDDFYMNGDFYGVWMTGNANTISNGRMLAGAAGALRIRAGGGDNTQTIDNVLMGSQTPQNVSAAGFDIYDAIALTITRCNVLQQGAGLRVAPANGQATLSLNVISSRFDNCDRPIIIAPAGTGVAARLYFTDCWASVAGATAGQPAVTIGGPAGSIRGVKFLRLQANLSGANACISTGTGIFDMEVVDSILAGSAYGIYCNNPIAGLKVVGGTIGDSDDIGGTAMTNPALTFDGGAGYTKVQIQGVDLRSSATPQISGLSNLGAGSRVECNTGYNGAIAATTPTVTTGAYAVPVSPLPTVVSVSGGTVSSIVINGTTVVGTSGNFYRGPLETMTVNNTVVPTITVSYK